ncbi:MAG: hypothetical protein A2342_03870 [Gallionellales bacterium RIFOXYB12_FULL_54_9]|nr:MAG: hypothetical protein A2342_03870 [Gallionellales bacterium RIFOXYB12_FULL_54_9]
MKKTIQTALFVLVNFFFIGPVHANVLTREVVQPAQGITAAQESCTKYAGDEIKEVACVLFHAGVVKKVEGKYVMNVQLQQPVQVDVNRTPGRLVKCRVELVLLKDGSIGWKDVGSCY